MKEELIRHVLGYHKNLSIDQIQDWSEKRLLNYLPEWDRFFYKKTGDKPWL